QQISATATIFAKHEGNALILDLDPGAELNPQVYDGRPVYIEIPPQVAGGAPIRTQFNFAGSTPGSIEITGFFAQSSVPDSCPKNTFLPIVSR
ncbi:hypothetical protein KA082_03105, partial [Candidatus Woesebacteria bacterium]|nr:hypothetical protein [Candidatus Woesebacteria bacterium]